MLLELYPDCQTGESGEDMREPAPISRGVRRACPVGSNPSPLALTTDKFERSGQ